MRKCKASCYVSVTAVDKWGGPHRKSVLHLQHDLSKAERLSLIEVSMPWHGASDQTWGTWWRRTWRIKVYCLWKMNVPVTWENLWIFLWMKGLNLMTQAYLWSYRMAWRISVWKILSQTLPCVLAACIFHATVWSLQQQAIILGKVDI